jgi:hypothetical protein
MSGSTSPKVFRAVRTAAVIGVVLVSLLFPARVRAQTTAAIWYGGQISITEEAIKGFEDTRFEPGRSLAGSAGFRFGRGFFTEFHFGRFDMRLTEDGDDFGRLHVAQVLLARFGYQGRPARPGVSGHYQLGGGVARSIRWENGAAIRQLERESGARMVVATGNNQPVFELGGGPDFFISRHFAIATDFRMLLMNVSTEWNAVGRRIVRLEDVDTFFASNFQAQVGLRLFLPR